MHPEVADFESRGGTEKPHLIGKSIDGTGQTVLLDDDHIFFIFLEFQRTGQSGRPGADDHRISKAHWKVCVNPCILARILRIVYRHLKLRCRELKWVEVLRLLSSQPSARSLGFRFPRGAVLTRGVNFSFLEASF